ncbi:hypothetical protein BV25DRAFT_1843706 [Artomyces pyxidatus]|uniref:Uncharacterized protein n=1 Tax=Artomyces pyxidatus TaxID=48021 RepID=A0ACB8SEQ5_9AGAM|nr:hypothetical protein BV25DRAFT_1843706 [Artomyces pyxidatus]
MPGLGRWVVCSLASSQYAQSIKSRIWCLFCIYAEDYAHLNTPGSAQELQAAVAFSCIASVYVLWSRRDTSTERSCGQYSQSQVKKPDATRLEVSKCRYMVSVSGQATQGRCMREKEEERRLEMADA